MTLQTPVIVGGARTPFLDTAGAYSELMAHELGAQAIRGAIEHCALPADKLDMVAMGIVLHEVETTNVTREAMLSAGLSSRIPAFTTAMAGLSPNIAVSALSNMIRLGQIEFALAGGMETFCDVPIRLSSGLRRTAMRLRQARTGQQRLKALKRLRPRDLALDIPKGTDFTTGMTMGESTEAMRRRYPVSREAADRYALRSHQRAVEAADAGWHARDICPVALDQGGTIEQDNSARRNLDLADLARLKPLFDPKTGVVTAGNASRFTDGAAALVLASQTAAERAGLPALAVVRDCHFSGVSDLQHEMLLGPAMTIPRLLERNRLSMDDIAVFEVHEAFAAQILINQQCLASDVFVREHLDLPRAPGAMPEERLNIHGGSLALGNPFAATGARLLLTAARRLNDTHERYALVSSCAGGGLGAAILLENPNL